MIRKLFIDSESDSVSVEVFANTKNKLVIRIVDESYNDTVYGTLLACLSEEDAVDFLEELKDAIQMLKENIESDNA